MLTSIDVKFIFDSARLGLFSSANILQIADVTLHLRWGVIIIFLLLLWPEREKNNAWYIYLTSRQPPPNLHNLTSVWPVMLLANKRLTYRHQILTRIMPLLKSILGKRKFLSASMFRWRFLKRILNVFKYC